MRKHREFDRNVEPVLVLQLDAVLAFVDHASKVAALTSLLVFYLETESNSAELTMEDWRLLAIGPGQPPEVAIYEHAILDIWRKAERDYFSAGNGGELR